MKRTFILSAVCASFLSLTSAENIADGSQIKPLKSFGPPAMITPKDATSGMIENQFDHTDRINRYYTTNSLDNSADPLHFQAGFYGRNFYDSLLYRVKQSDFYATLHTHFSKANGYEDGDGNDVEYGYKRWGQNLIVGFTPNEYTDIRFTFLHDDIRDDKQPHHQMDTTKIDRYVARLDARLGEADNSNTLNATLMYRKIDRKNNNYDLRKVSGNKVYIDLDRKFYEFMLSYDYSFSNWHNTIGAKYSNGYALGERYWHMPAGDFLSAYRFPGIKTNIYKIYDTISYRFNEAHLLSLGLEYEYNRATSDKYKNLLYTPQGKTTPKGHNSWLFWNMIYGKDFSGSVKENAFNAKLKYDFTPTKEQKYSVEIAHMQRVGDETERFTAMGLPTTGQYQNFFIGNPFLDKEKHNFIKLQGSYKSANYNGYMNALMGLGFEVGAMAMYDDVKDLIIYDRQKQSPAQGAIISRNADARLFVANLHAKVNFTNNLGASAKAIYAYGQNKSDSRPLYQIRPFEFNLALDYKDYAHFGEWSVGVAGRFVAKQNRGDFDKTTGLGADLQEAAKGFATMDLYASLKFRDNIGVRLGINNVFNKKYAEFISGNHVEALSPNLVYAPGRTFWLSLHGSF